MNRITVKVELSNGNNFVTEINGTIESVKKYYIGNVFNIGTDGDELVRAVNVQEVL